MGSYKNFFVKSVSFEDTIITVMKLHKNAKFSIMYLIVMTGV